MFYIRKETKVAGAIKALLAIAVGVLLLVAEVNVLEWVVQIIAAIFMVLGIIPLMLCLRNPQLQMFLPSAVYRIVIAILVFMLAGPIGGIIRYILAVVLIFYGVSKCLRLLNIVRRNQGYPGYSQYEDDSVDEQ